MARARNPARYRRKREQERCSRLGCRAKAVGQTKCGRHAARDRELSQRRRDDLKARGVCTKCGRPATKSISRCIRCAKKQQEYDKGRVRKKRFRDDD